MFNYSRRQLFTYSRLYIHIKYTKGTTSGLLDIVKCSDAFHVLLRHMREVDWAQRATDRHALESKYRKRVV